MANCPECGVNLEINPHRPGSGCSEKARRFFQAGTEKILEAPPRTYLYRDADKRREYMREYMRRRRNHACNDGKEGR